MKRVFLLAATAILLAGCSTSTPTSTSENMTPDTTADIAQTPNSSPESEVMITPVVVQLSALKSSGQTGTATFTDMGNGATKVALSLSGGKFTSPQPAHIHMGKCPTPGEVKYPLTNVVNGQSETIISAPMNTLWNGDMAINVHKSEKEVSVYTACGDLTQSGASASPAMMKTNEASPMASTTPGTVQNY